MYRLFVLAGLLALAVVVSGNSVKAEDKDGKAAKPKSIEEIMEKAHQGSGAFRAAVDKALKSGDLDKAAAPMKAWAALAPYLGSFNPPKGDKASWKKLTKQYAEQVKALSAAVKDKDKGKAQATLKKITDSCDKCHDVHKKEE